MAAQAAARTIKARLVAFAAEHWEVPEEQVVFLPGRVRVGNQEILFRELVWQAYIGARLAVRDRLLHDAQDPLGPRERPRPAVLLLRLWRGGAARSRSTR